MWSFLTRTSGSRPISETISYVEAPDMDMHGVANLIYENEDLPLTDPIFGAVYYDRSISMGAPPMNAPMVITAASMAGILTGAVAMQPLANPSFTANIANNASSTF